MAVTKETVYKLLTVNGAFLLNVPLGVYWFWGNLSVYVLSFYQRKNPHTEDSTSWVLLIHAVLRSAVFIVSEYVIRAVGLRKTIFIGIVLFNAGIAVNFLALQNSMWTLVLTLGVLCGVGAGLVYGPAFYSAVQWSDESNVGRIVSFVQCGIPFGAIVINQLTTLFLNPQNRKADSLQHGSRFFTQTAILDRVPVLFLDMGAILLAIQFLGLAMLRDRSEMAKNELDERSSLKIQNGASANPSLSSISSSSSSSSSSSYHDNEVEISKTENQKDENSDKINPSATNYSPLQLFQHPTFYVLLASCFLNEVFSLVSANYYKSFGQLWIRDDFFLTGTGTAMVIGMVPARFVCGLMLDRFGVKNTLIGGFAVIAVCCSFIYLAAMVSRWLYLVTVVVLGCVTGAFDIAYTVAPVIYFGRQHGVSNTGLLIFVALLLVMLVPGLVQLLVNNGYWSVLFWSGAGVAVVSVVLIMAFLPRK